ncbi:MAG: hypothetical protein MJA83_01130, partial [Gammaproteobacteria bacterium]|nr:hypothetical protein [Gammaproteobacteria bacterium]
AGAAAAEVFTGPATPGGDYAGWAGTLLFPFLGYDQFLKDWIFQTETVSGSVPDGTQKVFKNIEGAYDFVSILQAGRETALSNGLKGIWNEVITLFGFGPPDQDQDDLIDLANEFFWQAYGLSESDGFEPGNDLIFTKGGVVFGPSYFVGTLYDDTLSNGKAIFTTALDDIVHAGLGNDEIVLLGYGDVIDGGGWR